MSQLLHQRKGTLQAGPFFMDRHKWGVSSWPGGKLTCVKETFKTREQAQAHANALNNGSVLPNWDLTK